MLERPEDLRVFVYLTAEKAPLYRLIMASFMEGRAHFRLHLRVAEVFEAVVARRPDLAQEVGGVESALSQLCEWGNLERHQDTSEVRTVEEFYRPRYLYQLTREGEEAERAVQRYLAAIVEGGELQTAALGDIRKLLGELAVLASVSPIDEGKAFDAITQLSSRFEELTARAQTFMSSLQRTIDLRESDPEQSLLQYKDVLISYLQKFVLELRTSTGEIATKIVEIEQGNLTLLLSAVVRRELVDCLDQGDENRSRVTREWDLRWHGLRAWFLGERGQGPRAEVLRRKALSAIPLLLGAIGRLNDRRMHRTDRVTDLRILARWFAETDSDAEAHRLWMAAFGLTPARHLTIDSASLAAREAEPVPSRTSWLKAPSMTITPRLRLTGKYVRRGFPRAVIDRSKERAYLATLARQEAEQLEAARVELLAKGPVRLSSLGPLSSPAFNLFQDLLGDALAAGAGREGGTGARAGAVEVRSTDGTLLIRLEPTRDGRMAEVTTEEGTFSGPDHFISIQDAAVQEEAAERQAEAKAEFEVQAEVRVGIQR